MGTHVLRPRAFVLRKRLVGRWVNPPRFKPGGGRVHVSLKVAFLTSLAGDDSIRW